MAADEPDAGPDPVERLLDLCVFAPLGFVTDAGRLIPELAERGRQQATMARMVGEFAVTWGNAKVQDVVGQAQEQVVDVLQRFGVASPEPEQAPGAPVAPEEGPDEPTGDHEGTGEASADGPDGAGSVDSVDSTGDPLAGTEVVDEPEMIDIVDDVWLVDDGSSLSTAPMVDPVESATLAIPDYDNLSASQVVPRLDGLTPAELDAVLRYERGHRHRKTILNRIAQLQDGLG